MDWYLLLVPLALLPIVWVIRLVGCTLGMDFDIERNPTPVLIALGPNGLVYPTGGDAPYFTIPCTVRWKDLPPTGDTYYVRLEIAPSSGASISLDLDGIGHSEFQAAGTRLRWYIALESQVTYERVDCSVFISGSVTPSLFASCTPVEPLRNQDAILKWQRDTSLPDGELETLNCLRPAP